MKNKFKPVKYCYFFLDRLIQNEQNTALSNHFIKPAEYTCTTSGTIYSADVQIGDFSLQTKCIPLEAFVSKNVSETTMEIRVFPFLCYPSPSCTCNGSCVYVLCNFIFHFMLLYYHVCALCQIKSYLKSC